MIRTFWWRGYAGARKLAVAVVGAAVLLLGVVLIVLPGPAMLVIPAGLAILALEFGFAREWLARARWHSRRILRRLAGEPG